MFFINIFRSLVEKPSDGYLENFFESDFGDDEEL